MPITHTLVPFPEERFREFCKHLKILTKDFGLISFNLLGSQEYILQEIIKGMNEGISSFVILKSRQLGSSTFFMALDLFWAFNYSGLSGAIITHTEQLRDQFKVMIDVYLSNLPKGYKIKPRRHNRTMLQLRNGSTFQYMVAGTKESSKGTLGTGAALNFIHKSEESAFGNPEDLKNLNAAMSSHYPHRLDITETTARGFNHFSDTWANASSSQMQRVIFVGWWRNELFRFEKESMHFQAYMPEGMDSRYNVLERKRMKQVKDLYDYDIQPEQMAWYRWKLTEPPMNSDQDKMDEDFPWTPDDAFVATGSRFFTNASITDQMRRARSQPFMPFRYQLGFDWRETKILDGTAKRNDLRIWEEMNPMGRYVVSCDPAYGSSEEADRTAITVFRAYADRLVQVAEYCSPITSTHQCAWILAHLCGYYRNVFLIYEIQGPGQAVRSELDKLRGEMNTMFAAGDDTLRNCLAGMQNYLFRRNDQIGGGVQFQWKGNLEQKKRMMNRLKDSIELDRVVCYSLPALEEMKTIIYDQGSIEAEVGKKDDRVISVGLANFAWLEWMQGRLRQEGLTMLRASELEEKGGTEIQKNRMVLQYMEQAKILRPYDTPFIRR